MTTREKTYTFRAPEDLAPRTRAAFLAWRELFEGDDPIPESLLRDAVTSFCLAVARRARAPEQLENQSELFRTTFELFVEATEKAVRDVEFVRAYEEWAREDEEGHAVREGALASAAGRWRDE